MQRLVSIFILTFLVCIPTLCLAAECCYSKPDTSSHHAHGSHSHPQEHGLTPCDIIAGMDATLSSQPAIPPTPTAHLLQPPMAPIVRSTQIAYARPFFFPPTIPPPRHLLSLYGHLLI